MKQSTTRLPLILASAGLLAMPGAVIAQTQSVPAERRERQVDPRAETMQRMMRTISIELEDVRLEDAILFIEEFTGAKLEPIWQDDRRDGLDKDERISVSVTDATALDLLVRILETAEGGFSGNTWQMRDEGELQFGPREALNRYAFLKIYDVQDLLFEINDFTRRPNLDLDQILQASQGGGGGGGGGSIFDDDDEDTDRLSREQLRQQLSDLITTFIETDQWRINGGDGASLRFYQDSMIIVAPDYIHRELDGYSWWRGPLTSRAPIGGSRVATIDEQAAEDTRRAEQQDADR